jgi:hypothetical protein
MYTANSRLSQQVRLPGDGRYYLHLKSGPPGCIQRPNEVSCCYAMSAIVRQTCACIMMLLWSPMTAVFVYDRVVAKLALGPQAGCDDRHAIGLPSGPCQVASKVTVRASPTSPAEAGRPCCYSPAM